MTKLRVFLADDHVMIRTGLKTLIDAEPDMQVIGEASDGINALKEVMDLRPDVAVVDISMPQISGTQVTHRLKECCPSTRGLALTVHGDKSYLRQLMEAGAMRHLRKRSEAPALIGAIRSWPT